MFPRWEEEKYEYGVKWKFLEHKGPYFPPEYQPLPDDVKFYYDGSYLICTTSEKVLVLKMLCTHLVEEVPRTDFTKTAWGHCVKAVK